MGTVPVTAKEGITQFLVILLYEFSHPEPEPVRERAGSTTLINTSTLGEEGGGCVLLRCTPLLPL